MKDLTQKIISFSKKKGFVFPSSEIYGGFNSCYDFGPLGVELKNNIKRYWWQAMRQNGNIVGLDSSILMNPIVWQASGHLTVGFADELVECKECHRRFRDDFVGEKCPDCQGKFTPSRKFNLMMKTFVGPVEDQASQTYLRAETCQGIYLNFQNVLQTMRMKVPFGITQIGKAFRNEINPKDFIFRTREFEQMEMQWFCHPKEADGFFNYWKEKRIEWYLSLGVKRENLRMVEVPKEERSHYAQRQIDLEYRFPFGWKEVEGIHNRGDWDLSNHAKHSGKDLKYFDQEKKEKYFPYVIETSVGVERLFLALLVSAFQEIKGGREGNAVKEEEIVLAFDKKITPFKAVILPLVKNKEEVVEKAKDVYRELASFPVYYDETGSIGRRYRRADEIGVFWAITIDFDSLKDQSVTIRSRDTMKQERVKIKDLKECFIKEFFLTG